MVRFVSLELRDTTAAAAMEGPTMHVSLLLHSPRAPWTGAPLPLVNISLTLHFPPSPDACDLICFLMQAGRQAGGSTVVIPARSTYISTAASTWIRPSPLLSGTQSPLVQPCMAHLWMWMVIQSSSSVQGELW